MSRFLALAPPELYASALRVPWPADPLEQVRCLDAGTRALGLATTCAPWSADAEDAALADELDLPKGTSAGFDPLDEVTTWLGATPAAPPIFGLISGPAHWSGRVSDHPDALDIAADLAAGRVRALAAAGAAERPGPSRRRPRDNPAGRPPSPTRRSSCTGGRHDHHGRAGLRRLGEPVRRVTRPGIPCSRRPRIFRRIDQRSHHPGRSPRGRDRPSQTTDKPRPSAPSGLGCLGDGRSTVTAISATRVGGVR
jgi:hypothetical protein